VNISQFVAKWRKSSLLERAASQEHFIDLCRVFDHPTPAQLDSVGDTFTFEREVAIANGRRGRADVWKRDFFAWEYKSKHKDLDEAHDQLRKYREALLNPPLLAACDMATLDIRTNFTRKPTEKHEIKLADLGDTANRRKVEYLFWDPNKLEPGESVEAITDKAAGDLASIARMMRARDLDPKQVALFLDRVVFCLFAQSVRLLEGNVFSQIVEKTHADPRRISRRIFDLFETMSTGGECVLENVPHFNGDLFADVQAIELDPKEIVEIRKVCKLDWGQVDASIFGTLFERGMDPTKEAEIGTHYTRREDISAIVDPVMMEPLRLEWKEAKARADDLLDLYEGRKKTPGRAKSAKNDPATLRKARATVLDFLQRLQDVTILDPACGSGNFLYVCLQKLKDLEKEVLVYASERNLDDFLPRVGPGQLRGIEKSPYAYDLARVTIWIGWLQWTRANGYKVDWKPILSALDNLKNRDAIIDLNTPGIPKEPEWPEAEFIVGNPPFAGGKKLRRELTDDDVDAMFALWGDRVRPEADLCCYWFEKARRQVESGKAKRVGLLATQGIRGGASRQTLKRIKDTGDIFFAISDRDWIVKGANVHVSMVGFDDGTESVRLLDGRPVPKINSDLTSGADATQARGLRDNLNLAFMGDTKGGAFDVDEAAALALLHAPNPSGRPSSDVVLPWINGLDITRRNRRAWIVDYGVETSLFEASQYEGPFDLIRTAVHPARQANKRQAYKDRWWIHVEARPAMRNALMGSSRYLVTPTVSKYRLFSWVPSPTVPDHQLIVFAGADDYLFGVLHSRLHEVWARSRGTQVRERESGFRYTPTSCFETFAFPEPTAGSRSAIADAARNLSAARENWLNPREWTIEETLEFPGSAAGPWARLVHDPDEDGIGTVRYARRAPRDADCAAKLAKRTLTNLYNQRPTWLDLAHRKLDEAVFAAYGWKPEISDDEILSRLLALNLERVREESGAGRMEPEEITAPRRR
jgi:hypothetical protein